LKIIKNLQESIFFKENNVSPEFKFLQKPDDLISAEKFVFFNQVSFSRFSIEDAKFFNPENSNLGALFIKVNKLITSSLLYIKSQNIDLEDFEIEEYDILTSLKPNFDQ
jgi:hypothetical protein